jgi:hypothetical protein
VRQRSWRRRWNASLTTGPAALTGVRVLSGGGARVVATSLHDSVQLIAMLSIARIIICIYGSAESSHAARSQEACPAGAHVANPRWQASWRRPSTEGLARRPATYASSRAQGLQPAPHHDPRGERHSIAAQARHVARGPRRVDHDRTTRRLSHRACERAGLPSTWKVDPFSSAVQFYGWREREGAPTLFRPPPKYQALWVWLPKTWLLREGWTRHGLVSTHEVPGPHR